MGRSLSCQTVYVYSFSVIVHSVLVSTNGPQIKQTSGPRMVVLVGKDEVKLQCNVEYAQNYDWYKDGVWISPTFSDRYNVKVNRFLKITSVEKADGGLFYCVTTNRKQFANCSIKLVVADPTVPPGNATGEKPRFIYLKSMESVKTEHDEGDKFELTCEAEGTPFPVVTWYKDDVIYTGRQQSGYVIIPGGIDLKIYFNGVDIQDQGTYVCNVSNTYGWLTHSYKIDVKRTSSPLPTTQVPKKTTTTQPGSSAPLIVVPPKNLTAEKGDSVTLTCAAVGYPEPLIRWLVDERTNHQNPLDYNMSNLTITISKDETAVKCEAQNLVAVDSKTAFITVPKVEASVRSEGFFSGTGFVLVLGFAAVAVLLIVGAAIILYRCRKMQLQNFKYPVDADKLLSNPIFDQHSNYCSNPNLVNYEVPRNRMEFIEELEQGNALLFEYDAFIIYSSKDEEWVRGTLLPTLEDKHGFKCCIHYRDFMPGVLYQQNMVNSVYASKKTVAVVSKNFFKSGFCESEFEYALLRLAERRDDSLIVIKLDDIDTRKLPLEVRKRSYIDCPKSIEKETWETKLVKSLNS
ncbi:fibroblast growth factor receptor-like 1 isoform X2 [Montipora foliosa]|uniref:fibroblast growth factor receptor-like 1 isoform X2 n=1 Tax=Montipora foliosa TaxID=591990 RepID=UPI0035F17573